MIEEYFQGYKGSDEKATLSKEEIRMFELNSKAWCYIIASPKYIQRYYIRRKQ